jgi:hypothetical protein
MPSPHALSDIPLSGVNGISEICPAMECRVVNTAICQLFAPDLFRVISNRNQVRRSVSSIHTSKRLAVATSP